MICKVCGNEIARGVSQCSRCTALVADMWTAGEGEMERVPVRWLLAFATLPDILLIAWWGCVNSDVWGQWHDLSTFFFFVSFAIKFFMMGYDRRDLIRCGRTVSGWTYLGFFCSPVYIFGRDKVSAISIVSFVLWLICFCALALYLLTV